MITQTFNTDTTTRLPQFGPYQTRGVALDKAYEISAPLIIQTSKNTFYVKGNNETNIVDLLLELYNNEKNGYKKKSKSHFINHRKN